MLLPVSVFSAGLGRLRQVPVKSRKGGDGENHPPGSAYLFMPHTPIDGGYQLWARKTLESEIFLDKPAEWFKLWFYLVMRVHWSDDKHLPRGSTHITYGTTADILHITENQIDSFFRYARSAGMCTTRKTTRGVIVSLLSYAKYQDPKNYETATQTDTKPPRNRHGTATIEKEKKKERKKEGETNIAVAGAPADIVAVFDAFRPLNQLQQYGNKTERGAIEQMIKAYGLEMTLNAAKYAVSVQGSRYAPVITTPHKLMLKFGELVAYKERQTNPDNKKGIRL